MKIVQVPDGLKRKALEIAGDNAIYCEACYGGCDLAIDVAKKLNAEIIHYGHNKMIDTDVPVTYEEIRIDYDPTSVLEKSDIKGKIGLVTSLQYLDSLNIAKEFFGERAIIGKGKYYPGQILGCDISAGKSIEDKVDCFLFIGSGEFHAIGLALETEKPVYILSVEKNEIIEIDKEKFLKQRYTAIALANHANRFGILVSTKSGQFNIKLAEKIKDNIQKKGKKAHILIMNEIKPEKVEGIDVDCFINTACPRIAIDNRTEFKKPILNPSELNL